MVGGGNSRVGGEGVTRAELQTNKHGGDYILATTDSSTRQQYRTTVCTLKPTRSGSKPAI